MVRINSAYVQHRSVHGDARALGQERALVGERALVSARIGARAHGCFAMQGMMFRINSAHVQQRSEHG